MLTLLAPAKLNLFLHITGRRHDGYHFLESLIAFAGIYDTLHVTNSPDITLTITGRFGNVLQHTADTNSIIIAAKALAKLGNVSSGAAMTLEKELPIASGIGGGSSDAATALRLLSRHWNLSLPDDAMMELSRSLGSDVPCCYRATPAIMHGIGDQITKISALPLLPIVLVNPLKPLSTPLVYKIGVSQFTPSRLGETIPTSIGELLSYLHTTHNDLEAPATRLCPEITEIIAQLKAQDGCTLARMSGSGATCFGIFSSKATAAKAASNLQEIRPAWWIEASTLLAPKRNPL